jgi:hypothetical protein
VDYDDLQEKFEEQARQKSSEKIRAFRMDGRYELPNPKEHNNEPRVLRQNVSKYLLDRGRIPLRQLQVEKQKTLAEMAIQKRAAL